MMRSLNFLPHAAVVAILCLPALARAQIELTRFGAPATAPDARFRPRALDLTDDGLAVIGGQRDGGGALLRLDRRGVPLGPPIAAPTGIDDLAIDPRTGAVIAIGPEALVAWSSDLELLWQRPLPSPEPDAPPRRLAIGEHGTIAALVGDQLLTITDAGQPIGDVDLPCDVALDLAVFDADDIVVVTGWNETRTCDGWGDTAALVGLSLTGAPRWNAHDPPPPGLACDLADSRGVALARGADGALYLAAEVEGPRNIFRADPSALHPVFDAYTSADNLAPGVFTYYARLTPAGQHLIGQFFGAPADGPAQVRPRAIAADAAGTIYLVGAADHSLGRADETGDTEPLGALHGFFQVIERDLDGRSAWRQLEAHDMTSDLGVLALAGDRALALLDADITGPRDHGALPTGPSLWLWPGDEASAADKVPDPETKATFGYDSGVSGSDPTCYCNSGAPPSPLALFTGLLVVLAVLPRRR